MKTQIDKDIVYSGYKEPLKRFDGGYGYLGVVAFNRYTGQIQCHYCGNFYEVLTPAHLRTHGVTPREYRENAQIAYGTPLASEAYRKMLAERYEKIQKKLTPLQRLLGQSNRLKKSIESNKARKGQKINLETRNKRGNCPDQLLEKIRDLHKQMGEVPSKRQFMEAHGGRYMDLLYKTFGSYPNAVKLAGFVSKQEERQKKYSDEALLQYIRNFLDVNGRPPRALDCKLGRLPDLHVYINHFGSWVRAKEIAFFEKQPTAHIQEFIKEN